MARNPFSRPNRNPFVDGLSIDPNPSRTPTRDPWTPAALLTPKTLSQYEFSPSAPASSGCGGTLGGGLTASASSLDLSAGGSVTLTADLGPNAAGFIVWMLGSIEGPIVTAAGYDGACSPGLPTNIDTVPPSGPILPVGYDGPGGYLELLLGNPGGVTGLLTPGLTALDNNGQETWTFTVGAGVVPELAGHTVHHAFLVYFFGGPVPIILSTSNAVSIDLVA